MPALPPIGTMSAAGSEREESTRCSKASIAIHLNKHHDSTAYGTSSKISGYVAVESTQAAVDIAMSRILFLGCSITSAFDPHQPFSCRHTFLRIPMPLPQSLDRCPNPQSTVGAYQIPFEFVVPASLSTNACSHRGVDAVRDEHLCPLPSMVPLDKYDYSFKIARVMYSIHAEVRLLDREGTMLVTSQQVRVLPEACERPPLEVNEKDTLYSMLNRKPAKRQINPRSWITACIRQPRAVMIGSEGRPASMVFAQICLTFDSSSSRPSPPRSMKTRLKLVSITYARNPKVHVSPNMGTHQAGQGYATYTHSIALTPNITDEIQWKPHDNGQGFGDQSHFTQSSIPAAIDQQESQHQRRNADSKTAVSTCFTSRLQIPVRFRLGNDQFVPTFHSCFISRLYVLEVTLSFPDNTLGPSIKLRAPLQIGVNSDGAPNATQGAVDTATLDQHNLSLLTLLRSSGEGDRPPDYDHTSGCDVRIERDARLEIEMASTYALGQ